MNKEEFFATEHKPGRPTLMVYAVKTLHGESCTEVGFCYLFMPNGHPHEFAIKLVTNRGYIGFRVPARLWDEVNKRLPLLHQEAQFSATERSEKINDHLQEFMDSLSVQNKTGKKVIWEEIIKRMELAEKEAQEIPAP